MDAMGVIYERGDDLRDLLVPFVASRSAASSTEIADVYRRCSIGEISSADLWRELGVAGDPAVLDAEHLSAHQLADGLREFLAYCAGRGIRVACISNDVSEWSRWLRRRFELEAAISPWVISGDVGARKPEPAIYRHLNHEVGMDPRRMLVVDDRVRNVAAAKTLGFQTALFGVAQADKHTQVRGFSELVQLLELPHSKGAR